MVRPINENSCFEDVEERIAYLYERYVGRMAREEKDDIVPSIVNYCDYLVYIEDLPYNEDTKDVYNYLFSIYAKECGVKEELIFAINDPDVSVADYFTMVTEIDGVEYDPEKDDKSFRSKSEIFDYFIGANISCYTENGYEQIDNHTQPTVSGYRVEFKPETTSRGFKKEVFKDADGNLCSIQESSALEEDLIWVGLESADPRMLARDAILSGYITKKDIPKVNGVPVGWVSIDLPKELLLSTRMLLNKEQAGALAQKLLEFSKS